MLEKLFITVLNMSITGSFVIVGILAVRLLLRRAPKLFSNVLWLTAFFRLLCPVSFLAKASFLGLFPGTPGGNAQISYIPEEIGYMRAPAVQLPIPAVSKLVNGLLPAGRMDTSMNPLQFWLFLGACIWILGMLTFAVYSLISFYRRKKRMKIRVLGFLALMIHWFNPLVWAAFFLSGRDMERAGDEAVSGMTVVLCVVLTFILLANPKEEKDPVFYGVLVDGGETGRDLLVDIPGQGAVELPEAEEIYPYFETEEFRLEEGDLVQITFPKKSGVSVMETYPGRFSVPAKSIVTIWRECSLNALDSGWYEFSFAKGIMDNGGDAQPGDILRVYQKREWGLKPELLASAPILAIEEGEVPMVTIELDYRQLNAVFENFAGNDTYPGVRFQLAEKYDEEGNLIPEPVTAN